MGYRVVALGFEEPHLRLLIMFYLLNVRGTCASPNRPSNSRLVRVGWCCGIAWNF